MALQSTISQLPDAPMPLPTGGVFPLDVSVGGATRKTTLAQLATFIAAGGGASITTQTFDLTSSGGSANLPATGGNVYIHNSGSSVTLIPPPAIEGLFFTIIDADGTAGNFPILFQGFADPLIKISATTAVVQFHGSTWYRIR